MSVKSRGYDNTRRQAQVRRTRAEVVAAARDLFVQRGYAATTIEAIGEAAATPLATVYRLFGSKRGILAAVLDTSFVGDDEPIAMHERPAVRAAFAETDPRRLLTGFAHVCRELLDRSAPIQQVLRGAATADEQQKERRQKTAWIHRSSEFTSRCRVQVRGVRCEERGCEVRVRGNIMADG